MPIDLSGDVTVAPPVLPTVRVAPPASTSVTVLPVAGPTGPQGTPGGSYFVHTQSTPAATWVIDHNLAKKVHVSVFDDLNREIFADVEHGSINQTSITFPSPVTGSVVIS